MFHFFSALYRNPRLSGVMRSGSMNGWEVAKVLDKISLTGCKWSTFNAQSTEIPDSLGVMRSGSSQYEWLGDGKSFGQNHLNRLQMVQFEWHTVKKTLMSLELISRLHIIRIFGYGVTVNCGADRRSSTANR